MKAEDGENVVFSFIEWPDKATRDAAWEKIMADESLKPDGEMPFDGKRMFWGGFEPIVDTRQGRGRRPTPDRRRQSQRKERTMSEVTDAPVRRTPRTESATSAHGAASSGTS